MIIADTNVVSEFMRDEPHPSVFEWARSLRSSDLAICVVTIQEIEWGIGRLPSGKRQHELASRWERLAGSFADVIVPYDLSAARVTARILIAADASGRPMGLPEGQMAGICVAREHTLATKNLRDFQGVDELTLVNPFG
nr:type II toxin-antitoxin system VapC family toxin [Propionicimonas sp.]